MSRTILKPYAKRTRVTTPSGGVSMTQQNFKDECDINNILRKHKKTGLIDHVSQFNGDYADLSEPVDYQTALNIVIEAGEAFSTLPAGIRKMFNNSPQEFLEFADDENNAEKMQELGLLPKTTPADSSVPTGQNNPQEPATPGSNEPAS